VSAKPTPEQVARFEQFRTTLLADVRGNAYRAAVVAGYSRRMAKSKSYLLARRAWKDRKFRRRWHALYIAPIERRESAREAAEDRWFEAYLASLRRSSCSR
jgi:hypothetical protein